MDELKPFKDKKLAEIELWKNYQEVGSVSIEAMKKYVSDLIDGINNAIPSKNIMEYNDTKTDEEWENICGFNKCREQFIKNLN